jgi:hypothetical protein
MNLENTQTHEELAGAIQLAREQLLRLRTNSDSFSRITTTLENVADGNATTLRALERAATELADSTKIGREVTAALGNLEELIVDIRTVARQTEQRALRDQQEARTRSSLVLLVSVLSAACSAGTLLTVLRHFH